MKAPRGDPRERRPNFDRGISPFSQPRIVGIGEQKTPELAVFKSVGVSASKTPMELSGESIRGDTMERRPNFDRGILPV